MRNLIGRIIESDPALKVVGKAMNGLFALNKLPSLQPDMIILDLEMPEMDGITFLKERKRLGYETPVIILSSLATRSAAVTMEALNLGACDFIMKPSGSASEDLHAVSHTLLEMIHSYGSLHRTRKMMSSGTLPAKQAAQPAVKTVPSPGFAALRTEEKKEDKSGPLHATGPIDIVAIGISTGGPNALREVFSAFDPQFKVPTVVVQHMPAGFTAEFAKSLDRICPQEVKEAEDGDIVKPGRILIAPGNRHVIVEKKPLAIIARIIDTELVNGHRPSADVLFESVAKNFGGRSMAVIMTGMGKDGAQQIGSIYRAGGLTLGQDEASSIVYGMPKVAFENGFVQRQIPLNQMAETICRLAKEANG
jgi:two-component system chemotaxis response regulator CheB